MKPDRRAGGSARSRTGTHWLLILLFGWIAMGCSGEAGDPALYRQYCSACHGPEGEGLRALYPPLADSAYMDEKLGQLPCLIVNGAGTTVVMPGFPQLEIAEIAELATYLTGRWAMNRTKISEEQVATWLHHCP